ncbi:IS66 family transposase [Bacillus thuringiensis]
MNRKDILLVYKQGPNSVVNLVETLCTRIQELEFNAKKNSKNSHKPPSMDGLQKPTTKSLREKTDRKTGGQPGHKGHTLSQVEHPDYVVVHPVTMCSCCQSSLENEPVSSKKVRQVFDIPPVSFEVLQHEVERKICPRCFHIEEAPFPKGVTNATQYGPNVQLMVNYLTQYQYLSLQRTAEFFRDVYQHSISQGTINRLIHSFSESLQEKEEEIRSEILASPIVHCDETGLRNQGKTEWVHTYSTPDLTIQYIHQNRGSVAMDEIGVMPAFTGIAVHDCWKSYFQYDKCQHVLCNVHLLRELRGILEQTKQEWAQEMADFLLKAKNQKETGKLDAQKLVSLHREYETILAKGEESNPIRPKEKNVRGRQKQSLARNLLNRLTTYQNSILAFLLYPAIPFDNNQAERDIRPVKLRQKISGSFRSEYGARNYLRIRSYMSTIKKQGKSIFRCTKEWIETGELDLSPN